MQRITHFTKLEEKCNYHFKNYELLKNALTHTSYVNEHGLQYFQSNERLEFLGDSIIGFIMAEYFFLKSHENHEGTLSKQRAKVVNEHILATIANHLEIGSMIYFGRGEEKNGGRYRESILADAFEALIGAIYLDSDFETVKSVVLTLFQDSIQHVDQNDENGDFKSILQEHLQNHGMVPTYQLVRTSGPDNNKIFYSTVSVEGKVLGFGQGRTKKKSEQYAAKEALKALEKRNE